MGRSYALFVSFDPERLVLHQLTEREAQGVGECLEDYGFSAVLPGFYVGSDRLSAVQSVVAVQDLADRLAWFSPCLRSARLLRIEEDSDLMVALK
jgi:virulence-associated protein VapD